MTEMNSDDDERIQCLKIVLQQCIGTDEKLTKKLAKILESNEVVEKDETLKRDGFAEEKQTSIAIDEMLQRITGSDDKIKKLPDYLKDAGAPENVIKLVSAILGDNASNVMLQLVKIWLNPNENKKRWEEKIKELWPKKHGELTINWLVEFITSCTAEMLEKLQVFLKESEVIAKEMNDSDRSEPNEIDLGSALSNVTDAARKHVESSNASTIAAPTSNVTQNFQIYTGFIAGTGSHMEFKDTNVAVQQLTQTKDEEVASIRMGRSQQDHKKALSSREENIVWVVPQKLSFDRSQHLGSDTKVFKGKLHDTEEMEIALKIITIRDKDKNKREVQNLKAAARHQNVIKYFDAGFFVYEGQEAIYIAMELCDHETLYDKLKPDSGQSVGYAKRKMDMEGIAKGLNYIHSLHIVHRDFKPPNILYKDGIAVVTDFGLSVKLPDSKTNAAASRSDAGTNGWRAPETSDEKNPITSQKSDVYSAGLVFYFTLTGEHPYDVKPDHRQYHIDKNKSKKFSLKALEGKPDAEIAEDLIGLMLQHERSARPTMEEVLSHPFFFEDRKKLEFLSDVIKYLKLVKANEDPRKQSQETETSEERKLPLLICSASVYLDDNTAGKYSTKTDLSNWKEKLTFKDEELQVLLRRCDIIEAERESTDAESKTLNSDTLKDLAKNIKTDSVTEIIRFIRNSYTHNHEDQGSFGLSMPVEELWKFFNGRFPYIFLYVYYKMKNLFQNKMPSDENYSDTMARYFMTQKQLQEALSGY